MTGNARLLHGDQDETGLMHYATRTSKSSMCVNAGGPGTEVHVLLIRVASAALGERRRTAQDMATGNGCVTGEGARQVGSVV